MYRCFQLLFLFFFFFNCAHSAPQNTDALFEGSTCDGVTDEAKVLQCVPSITSFSQKVAALGEEPVKVNDTNILGLINECRQSLICIEPTCISNKLKNSIKVACASLQLKNTEYMNCLIKIKTENPDMSKYECLGGLSLNDPNLDLIGKDRNCAKSIMEDVCGAAAVENFDYNVALSVKLAKLAVAMMASVPSQ